MQNNAKLTFYFESSLSSVSLGADLTSTHVVWYIFKLDTTLTHGAWCIKKLVDSTLPFALSLATGFKLDSCNSKNVTSALMTELVGSVWEKRCGYFVILNAIPNLPKMENFDIKPLYYHT